MPFNSAGVRALTPCEVDEMPEPDASGRLALDGWKITWAGTVQPGKSSSYTDVQVNDLQDGRHSESMQAG